MAWRWTGIQGFQETNRKAVLTDWLQRESDTNPEWLPDDETELLIQVLENDGGAGRHLWHPAPSQWYRGTLSPQQFETLRVIESPDGIGWSALAPDETVITAARQILNGSVPDTAGAAVDIDKIRRLAQQGWDGAVGPLVLVTAPGWPTPRIIDGNHRATALGMTLLETGQLPTVEVYLGVRPVRTLRDLFGTLRWKVQTTMTGLTRQVEQDFSHPDQNSEKH